MLRRLSAAMVAGLVLLGICLPAAAAETTPPTSSATPAPAAPSYPDLSLAGGIFSDLHYDNWAYKAAKTLLEAGVVSQDPMARFRPTDPVRRSELFKMVLAARRIQAGSECQALFTDVPCTAWFAPYAETAYRMAIAEGKGEGLFAPDAAVTRQELFTILVRATGRRWAAANQHWTTVSQQLKAFTDAGEIADWARPSVAFAVAQGMTTGGPDGKFNPKGITTRAEAAVAISRILLPEQDYGKELVDGTSLLFTKAMTMTASMYTSGEPGVGTITYTGVTVRRGAIAVDPTVIPLGSLLYVEGYGYGVAVDIGGAIKGNRIDLFTDDLPEALRFGLAPARVWVLP